MILRNDTHRRMFIAMALLAIIGAPFFTLGTVEAEDSAESAVPAPKVLLVKFHADWCPKCRSLVEPYNTMTEAFSSRGLLAIKFDITDDQNRHQSAMHAALVDMEQTWMDHGAGKKTGFMLLVDAQSKQTLAVIKSSHSESQIREMIRKALK